MCRDSGFSVTRKSLNVAWHNTLKLPLRIQRFRAKTAHVLNINIGRNKAHSTNKLVQ